MTTGALITRPRQESLSIAREIWLPMLTGGLVLGTYIRTLAPTVFPLDSAELTTAAYTLGIPHGPGYPLYLLLAHGFTYLPIGDVAYRVNLLSAVTGAGMVALITCLVERFARHWLPAVIAGLSLGFSFYAWSVSVIAEVYTLQGLLLAGLLWTLWKWRAAGRRRDLFLAAALLGLATANTPATLLWWPGLLFLAWFTPHRRRLSTQDSLLLGGLFILALSPLLYLPWRSAASPPFVYAGQYDATGAFHPLDLTRPRNLLWYVTGQQFGNQMFAYTPVELAVEIARFAYQLWGAFLGIGLPLGIAGIWLLWRRDRGITAGLGLIALGHTLFFLNYRVADKETMFLPVLVIWAIFLGLGVQALQRVLPRHPTVGWMLLPLALLLVNSSYADASQIREPHEQAVAHLTGAPANAIYLAAWRDAATLQYLQTVHGLRSDVTVINTFFITPDSLTMLVDRAMANGRAVYATHLPPILAARYRFISVDHGLQILPREETP